MARQMCTKLVHGTAGRRTKVVMRVHIPSPSVCKVTVKHTGDKINILLRYTKIKMLKKTPAMGGT